MCLLRDNLFNVVVWSDYCVLKTAANCANIYVYINVLYYVVAESFLHYEPVTSVCFQMDILIDSDNYYDRAFKSVSSI